MSTTLDEARMPSLADKIAEEEKIRLSLLEEKKVEKVAKKIQKNTKK